MEGKKIRRGLFNSESGAILPIVIILTLALTITGLAFLSAGVMENSLVRREIHKNQAFYLAEAGLERTLWNLKQDFEDDQNWTDDINEIAVAPQPNTWVPLPYEQTSLGDDGSYEVKLEYVNDPADGFKKDEIWVKSTGTVKGTTKTVQVYVKIGNLSPWNNAIFAGIGAGAGTVISGNSLIHGSVLILGAGLEPDALAMDTIGTAGIRNNYEGMLPGLAARVPQCPITTFNEEIIESLGATLRVKQGKVGLSGTAEVGEKNEAYNSFKETMDGVYVQDGYGGNKGAINVHSDNGFGNPYDLDDSVEFPSLLGGPYVSPDTGWSYDTYLEYLEAESLHITVGEGKDVPESKISFEFDFGSEGLYGKKNVYGGIGWYQYTDPEETDPKKKTKLKLEIEGIVWMEADSLDLGEFDRWLEYSGTGTIVVASPSGDGIVGDIITHGHLVAEGIYDGPGGTQGFPNNVLGLITGKLDLGAGESQVTMTGAFYAENEIVSAKQNNIAGTSVSNYFDMGGQVPRIYQVPELATKLPKGMPGGEPDWHVITSQWSELAS